MEVFFFLIWEFGYLMSNVKCTTYKANESSLVTFEIWKISVSDDNKTFPKALNLI